MTSPRAAAELPIGVVLAGGAGRRLGGRKAVARLAGRPLLAWPLTALGVVLPRVVVQAKPDSLLPDLPGTEVWREPAAPRHPGFALVWALERAAGSAVLVCAADLPFVTPSLVGRLLDRSGAAAAVLAAAPAPQPLLGLYRPAAAEPLRRRLAAEPQISLRRAVDALAPILVAAAPDELTNINTPEDLRQAERRLSRT